jgi:branched-chain amino acid transport system ATP-binding protein
VLRVNGLSVSFGGVRALDDVDLEVREGELVGLIGPNGAGKTTLVDAVTGFVHFSGAVELDGRDIGRLPPYERARLGLGRTWQSTDLFDDLDVRENLTVASGRSASVDGVRDASPPLPVDGAGEVDATLGMVGLDVSTEAMPSQLSQGQRKLVGIARALASRPRLLCLDEPAAGLDTNESQLLGQRLRELANHGQSTLLIDHDMGLVLSICDRVVVLEFGKVIADDAPDVVRRDPNVISAYLGGGSQSDALTDPNGRGSLAL